MVTMKSTKKAVHGLQKLLAQSILENFTVALERYLKLRKRISDRTDVKPVLLIATHLKNEGASRYEAPSV